jgi:hypothetical protein
VKGGRRATDLPCLRDRETGQVRKAP